MGLNDILDGITSGMDKAYSYVEGLSGTDMALIIIVICLIIALVYVLKRNTYNPLKGK